MGLLVKANGNFSLSPNAQIFSVFGKMLEGSNFAEVTMEARTNYFLQRLIPEDVIERKGLNEVLDSMAMTGFIQPFQCFNHPNDASPNNLNHQFNNSNQAPMQHNHPNDASANNLNHQFNHINPAPTQHINPHDVAATTQHNTGVYISQSVAKMNPVPNHHQNFEQTPTDDQQNNVLVSDGLISQAVGNTNPVPIHRKNPESLPTDDQQNDVNDILNPPMWQPMLDAGISNSTTNILLDNVNMEDATSNSRNVPHGDQGLSQYIHGLLKGRGVTDDESEKASHIFQRYLSVFGAWQNSRRAYLKADDLLEQLNESLMSDSVHSWGGDDDADDSTFVPEEEDTSAISSAAFSASMISSPAFPGSRKAPVDLTHTMQQPAKKKAKRNDQWQQSATRPDADEDSYFLHGTDTLPLGAPQGQSFPPIRYKQSHDSSRSGTSSECSLGSYPPAATFQPLYPFSRTPMPNENHMLGISMYPSRRCTIGRTRKSEEKHKTTVNTNAMIDSLRQSPDYSGVEKETGCKVQYDFWPIKNSHRFANSFPKHVSNGTVKHDSAVTYSSEYGEVNHLTLVNTDLNRDGVTPGQIKIGDVVTSYGEDVTWIKECWYVGVYKLIDGRELGAKVGVVKTMYDQLPLFTNRVGVVAMKTVINRMPPTETFKSRVHGCYTVHLIDGNFTRIIPSHMGVNR